MLEEFKIKNWENTVKCYNKYWRCEDYSCPLFAHCSTGLIEKIPDYEIRLLFKHKEGE